MDSPDRWLPQPGPQLKAIEADWCDELFFGGARGGGKSDFLLGDYLEDIDYGSTWRGIIFRKTYLELEELQIRATEIFPPLGGVYKVNKSVEFPFSNCWYFPGGATLKMRYLDHERDADGYQGHQYTWIGFDELTNHATPYGYNKLKACLRNSAGIHGRIRASGNPGGKGHIWVKARFIDNAPPYTPYDDPETGLTRMFIPSKVTDNKYLRDNKQYLALLKSSGSVELVKAWLDGDWDVVAGAFFDCWDRSKHVIRPFTIPKDWKRFRSFDWGSSRPFSVGWWAIADGETNHPRGSIIRYREWYGASEPNVGLKLTAEAVAQGIIARDRGESFVYSVADPSCWKVDGGPSIAERMMKEKVVWRRADNQRINGWDQMRSRFIGIDGEPLIYTFDTCVDSIRTIPLLQHDETYAEDIDTDMEDHCFAAGTMVDTLFGQVPIETLPECGFVLSVNGRYERYRSARLVKRNVEVVRLLFSNGVEITCTPDHKYLVDTDEWRYACDLLNEEVICSQPSLAERFKSLTDYGITYAVGIFSAKVSGFTSWCGKLITAKHHQAITFIISMGIEATTSQVILSASACKTISANGTARKAGSVPSIASIKRELQQRTGMGRRQESNGIQTISRRTFVKPLKQKLRRYAKNAGTCIWSVLQGFLKVNIVGTTVGRVRCVSVEKMKNRADVYCLTVPKTATFAIEGGLLVSNCADDWRYACMSRPWVKPEPSTEAARFDTDLTINEIIRRRTLARIGD